MRLLCILIREWPVDKTIMADFLNRVDDIAPLVENTDQGILYAEIESLIPLYDGTGQLIELFRTECNDFGLDCSLGIADSRLGSFAAALSSPEHSVKVVPSGKDQSFLKPFPVTLLPIAQGIVAALHDLGIRTLGDLVRHSETELIQAFGDEAGSWVAMASASNELPLSHHNMTFPLTVSLSFDFPVIEKSQLVFAVESPLASLVSSLKSRSHGASVLLFRFYDEDGTVSDLPLSLAFPATRVEQILRSFRCHVASFRFHGAPVAIDIKLLRSEPAFEQQSLFFDKKAAFNDRSKVSELLERLVPLAGQFSLGWFHLIPSRIPEKMWELLPWGHKADSAFSPGEKTKAGWPLLPGFGTSPSYAALRLFPVASSVGVNLNEYEEPLCIDGTPVVQVSGPFKTIENWWQSTKQACERLYYEVLTEDGVMLWLYRSDDGWYLQGVFD